MNSSLFDNSYSEYEGVIQFPVVVQSICEYLYIVYYFASSCGGMGLLVG